LREMLPTDPEMWQRDYLTQQPWKEYYPDIVRLRLSSQTKFYRHLRALSTLSNRLLVSAVLFLLLVTIFIFLPVHFPRWQILVLYGTLFQPIVILLFVYWAWNRFDLSLDAIVKYFASGFFICTGISIFYEMIVSAVATMIIFLISLLGTTGLIAVGTIDINDLLSNDDDYDVTNSNSKEHSVEAPVGYSITIALIAAFLNSFIVAAAVEEIGKYLCFWMVEHPDFENDKVLLSSASSALFETNVEENEKSADNSDYDVETTKLHLLSEHTHPAISQTVLAPTASLVSLGAATTIAMITV